MRRTLSLIGTLAAFVSPVGTGIDIRADGPVAPKAAATRRADQDALQRFAPLVGQWKGTGQVKRGSSQGAWTETGDWAWKLTPDSARLEWTAKKGKFLRSVILTPTDQSGMISLTATLADGSERMFRSEPGDDGDSSRPVAFRAVEAGDGVRRLVISTPNEARFLLTLEALPNPKGPPVRLGELGSTRVGATFAAAGAAGPVCVVTGGRGTMQVTHNGKSYWVCCSGCRDLFNDDPAAVLADAASKKEKATTAKP